MKRFTQLICLFLIASMTLSVPALAAEVTPRASNYFSSYSCYLWEVSGSEFQVWFDVTAVGGMQELGVSSIEIQRSTDKINWTTVKTYTKESYPSLIAKNTGDHCAYVTYSSRTSGYYYRAFVTFYAKNSSGTAYYYDYTSSL